MDDISKIEILYNNNVRIDLEKNKSNELYVNKIKENENIKYMKYCNKIYKIIFIKKWSVITIEIEKEIYNSEKRKDKDEVLKKYEFEKIDCEKIEKKYIGNKEIIKNIDKKNYIEINVNNKNDEKYREPKIEIENEKCILKNDKGEIIGTIEDKRSLQSLKNLNYNKHFTFLNRNKLEIRAVDGNKDLGNYNLKLFINRELEDSEKQKKNYTRRINGLFEKDIDKLYLFIRYERYEEEEVEEIEILLPEEKSLICSFVMEGLYIKSLEKTRRSKKNTRINVFKLEKENLEIEVKDIEKLHFDEKLKENIIYKEINNVNYNSEFLTSILKYQEIESKLLEKAEEECAIVNYSNLDLVRNRFIIPNEEIKNLKTWENKEGYTVVYPTKEKKNIKVGEIREISINEDNDDEYSGGESYIKVDFETDIEKNILSRNGGKLKISFIGDSIRNKRREDALENFKRKNTANEDLFDIIDGKYYFEDLNYENKLSNIEAENLSDKQISAIEGVLNTKDIFLIQGPPGTGKTRVITKIIKRLIKDNKEVLVSSAQNLAVDNVMEGIFEEEIVPYRYGDSENKAMKVICENLADSISDNIDRNISKESEEELINNKKVLNDLKISLINIDKEKIKEKLNNININNKIIDKKIEDLKREINCIDDEKEEFGSSSITGDYIKKNLPKYDSDERYIVDIDNLLINIRINNIISDKKSQTIENIINLLEKSISYDIRGSERSYNNIIKEIESQCDCIKSKSNPKEKWKNIIQEKVYEIDYEIDRLGDYANDPNYSKIKEFRDRVKNNILLLEDAIGKYPDVMGTTCQKVAAKGFRDINNDMNYDYVIIDEAGRSDPIDLLIPISRGKKVILVGDHKQLPHLVDNAVEEGLKELSTQEQIDKYIRGSLFGRLYEELPSDRKIMLDTQYRMNKEIGDAVSSLFYENKLKTGKNESNENDTPLYNGKSLIAINVNSKQSSSKKSYKNDVEINFIISKLKEIDYDLEEYTKENRRLSIGVISFYKLQSDIINKRLRNCNFKNIDVSSGTVDSYQGLEKDIIIISSVRTEGIGFIANKNRLNVALSRAKKIAIIVGNLENLRKNETFRLLLDKCNCKGE